MKIVAVSMIGNEADVVECFVRHTLTRVDRLVVILHRSVDGTADIVGALDADEFLKLPSPDFLHRALPAVPGKYFAAARWLNYLPMHVEDLANSHVLRGITHCRQVDTEPFYKVMLNPGFLQEGASLFEGSHCVMREMPGGHAAAPRIELKAIRLAHFPVRSPFQMARKARIGALAKSLKSDHAIAGLGTHWQGLLEQVRTHPDMSFERLRSIAFHYPQTFSADAAIDERVIAHNPIACNFELGYSHLIRTDLEGILADWARA